MQIDQAEQSEYPPTQPVSGDDVLPVEEPTPNNPPWGAGTAIVVWIASILLIILLPNLILLPYIAAQNLDFSNEAALREFVDSNPTAVVLRIASIIPAHLVTLLMSLAVVTKFNKYSFRKTLGWAAGLRWWHYFMILGGFYMAGSLVNYFFPEQDNEMIRILQSSRAALFLVAFLATFSAPLVEEVIYRGILFSALQRAAGGLWAIAIVTLLFAGVHFFQYWGSPGTIILITLLSLILTLIRYRTKSLLPCIILHTLVNGLQSLVLVLAPLLEKYTHEETPQAIINLIK